MNLFNLDRQLNKTVRILLYPNITFQEDLEKLLNDINSKMKQEFDTLSKESSN